MIAGTNSSPGCGIAGSGKLPHVVAEFGDDLLRTASTDTGNRVEVLKRGCQRRRGVSDPTIKISNLLFEKLEVSEQTAEEERVMIGEASDEHLRQCGAFVAQPPLCQLRQRRRTCFG